MGKAEADMCRFCECETKTAEHVVCYYRNLKPNQLLHYGEESINNRNGQDDSTKNDSNTGVEW